MRLKRFRMRALWYSLTVLFIVSGLFLINSKLVVALSLSDYFTFSYNITFTKTEVKGSEVFYATVSGQGTCVSELPLTPSEARVTGRIIAQHQVTSTRVTLNTAYTVTLNRFPTRKGESIQESLSVPLQFPKDSQSGTYNVVSELVEAKVNVMSMWLDVASFLPSSTTAGSVLFVSDGGGGAGGPLAPPAKPSLPAGTTDISGLIDPSGIFTQNIVASSPDSKCQLKINSGTKGVTAGNTPLTVISVAKIVETPPTPQYANIIGLAYDFKPDGAIFSPPVSVVFVYDDSLVTEGVDEKNLVLAFWDVAAGKWIELQSSVDPQTHTITAKVAHFTTFVVLAGTRPAEFSASQLSILPVDAAPGEALTVIVLIANDGDISGQYEAILRMDDSQIIGSKEIALAGRAREPLTFTIRVDTIGAHVLSVANVSGTFLVRQPTIFSLSDVLITPLEVGIGEEVTVSVLVANAGELEGSYLVTLKIDGLEAESKKISLAGGSKQRVRFATRKEASGNYLVDVNGLGGSFTVRAKEKVPQVKLLEKYSWWLVSGASALLIMIVTFVWLYTRQRRF